MKHPFLLAALVLATAAPASARLVDGVVAIEQGALPPAMAAALPLAQRGQPEAQYAIGLIYYQGSGIEKDLAKAAWWWRKAARQGYANAQYNLGVLYYQGQGVGQDQSKAATLWRQAAEQGHREAQYNLGIAYSSGRGVPVDYDEAAKWYRKAAEQGGEKAQYNLGVLYAKGQAVPADYVQAHVWFSLAAADSPPGELRDKAAHNRDILAARLTPAQLGEARRLARELMAGPN